jgi:hypothetical protein
VTGLRGSLPSCSSSAVAGAAVGDPSRARCSRDSSLLPYEGVAAVVEAAASSVPSNLGMVPLGVLDFDVEPNMPERLGRATVGALGNLDAFGAADAVGALASTGGEGGGAPVYGL